MGFSRLACPQNGILTIPTVQFMGYSLIRYTYFKHITERRDVHELDSGNPIYRKRVA